MENKPTCSLHKSWIDRKPLCELSIYLCKNAIWETWSTNVNIGISSTSAVLYVVKYFCWYVYNDFLYVYAYSERR